MPFLRGEWGRSLLRPMWSALTTTYSRKIGSDPGGVLVAKSEVTAFIERCMVAVGTKPAHAKALADNLTMADYRGHFSHGLNRLGIFTCSVVLPKNRPSLPKPERPGYFKNFTTVFRHEFIELFFRMN